MPRARVINSYSLPMFQDILSNRQVTISRIEQVLAAYGEDDENEERWFGGFLLKTTNEEPRNKLIHLYCKRDLGISSTTGQHLLDFPDIPANADFSPSALNEWLEDYKDAENG